MIDDILEEVCPLQRQATPLFILDLALLVMLLAVFPFVERGSATFYVSLLSFVIIGSTLLVWLGLKYKCRKLEDEKPGFLERETETESD